MMLFPSVHLTALTNACQDFADCLRDSLKPSRDREMQVEWVQSFWDWHSYMEPLGVSLGGLAIMDHYEEVNFSFRMVQRQDLKAYQGYDKWVVMTDGQDLKLLCSKKNCDQGMIKPCYVHICSSFIYYTPVPQRTWKPKVATLMRTSQMFSFFAGTTCIRPG